MKKIKRTLLIFLMIFLVSLMMAYVCQADDGTECSVTVDYSVDNHTLPISGGTFSIAKVLDLENGEFKLTKEAGEYGVQLKDIIDNSEETAKKLALEMSTYNKEKTDASGKAIFGNLTAGVWLIWQSDSEGTAKDYDSAVPSFVQVPTWNDSSYVRDVTVYPKTVRKEIVTKPAVKTGDSQTVILWVIIAVGSVIAVATAIVEIIRKKKNHE